MQMRRTIVMFGLVFGAFFAVAQELVVADTMWPANVGAARLILPVPTGFAEATQSAPHLRLVSERLTPPTNRLLAHFVDGAEVAALRPDAPVPLRRYFLVQTFRQTESSDWSSLDFDQLRALLRGQYRQLLAQSNETMQGQIDAAVRDLRSTISTQISAIRVGEIKGLEVFVDNVDAISLSAVTRYAVQANDRTVEVPMVMASTTAVIGRKLVYFYAFSVHRGDADLEWVKAQSRVWLKSAVALNP